MVLEYTRALVRTRVLSLVRVPRVEIIIIYTLDSTRVPAAQAEARRRTSPRSGPRRWAPPRTHCAGAQRARSSCIATCCTPLVKRHDAGYDNLPKEYLDTKSTLSCVQKYNTSLAYLGGSISKHRYIDLAGGHLVSAGALDP